MAYLAAFQGAVFLALALLHAYWALGGQAGLTASLPAYADGRVILQPSPGLVWLVALVLLLLAALNATQLLPGLLPPKLLLIADGLVAAGLLLRTVGDFRYVGLTKQVKATTFARLDTRYYTPLCLLLAAGHAALAVGSW